MGLTAWLIDKSALVRMGRSADRALWTDRMQRGLVRIAPVTRLEIGYSARSGADARSGFSAPPLSLLPVEYSTPMIEDRALAVQLQLADRGQHRAPSLPDLMLSATAELAGLTVLHVDKDFELIADVTGQSVERLRE